MKCGMYRHKFISLVAAGLYGHCPLVLIHSLILSFLSELNYLLSVYIFLSSYFLPALLLFWRIRTESAACSLVLPLGDACWQKAH